MAQSSVLYKVFGDIVDAMKNIVPAKYIRLKDRPKLSDGEPPIQKMAVIDLPFTIRDYVIGDDKTMLKTRGVIYLFVCSKKDYTMDVTPLGDMVDSVIGIFPIKGKHCSCTNPETRLLGDDGTGFQVATVTFNLRCRWNTFR